jgi:hypothetical protein
VQDLLRAFGLAPVLVDVGASIEAPGVWKPIAPLSTYVGFDPDSREAAAADAGGFARKLMVGEAVTADPAVTELRFHLTRAPGCSSTLAPDLEALADYHYRDFFETEREAVVRAATLDAILGRLGIDRIDWLKCDTQGTDLRIFRSLSAPLRAGLMAIDVEPGLIDAYRGEDLFADTHEHLCANGFWLSRLDVHGPVRMRDATLKALYGGESDRGAFAQRHVRNSPGWCEARYLRTPASLAEAGRDRYAMLFMFALLDAQPGFALDVALAFEQRFGADAWSARMRAEAMAAIARGPRERWLAGVKGFFGRLLG